MEPSRCPAKKKRGTKTISNFCFVYMPILWKLIFSIRKGRLEVLYSVLASIDSVLGSFGLFWPGGDQEMACIASTGVSWENFQEQMG